MDNDPSLLVRVIELRSNSNAPPDAVDLDESMFHRCEAAERQLEKRLLASAEDFGFKRDYVAVLPLFPSDFKVLRLLRRPCNTWVSSNFFEAFVWKLADQGFVCFIDRPGVTSSLLSNVFGTMPEMKLKYYEVQEKIEDQYKVEWVLYVLLPGCTPPRHYWIRNILFHIRGYLLLIVGIIFYLWVGCMVSSLGKANNPEEAGVLIAISLLPTAIYLAAKYDIELVGGKSRALISD